MPQVRFAFRFGSREGRVAGRDRSEAREQTDAANKDTFAVSALAINPPKGGGAIRGMGDKFATNPVTCTGSMSVPLYTSLERARLGPTLSLSYDSGTGNGPFGFG
jgi:hypothetical protein